jgi:hypothetical protein
MASALVHEAGLPLLLCFRAGVRPSRPPPLSHPGGPRRLGRAALHQLLSLSSPGPLVADRRAPSHLPLAAGDRFLRPAASPPQGPEGTTPEVCAKAPRPGMGGNAAALERSDAAAVWEGGAPTTEEPGGAPADVGGAHPVGRRAVGTATVGFPLLHRHADDRRTNRARLLRPVCPGNGFSGRETAVGAVDLSRAPSIERIVHLSVCAQTLLRLACWEAKAEPVYGDRRKPLDYLTLSQQQAHSRQRCRIPGGSSLAAPPDERPQSLPLAA